MSNKNATVNASTHLQIYELVIQFSSTL